MYKDLENYARFVQCIAATATTAELAILGVGGDLAPYLKAEAENESTTGDWIQSTLWARSVIAARADFYTTLLFDAGGDPEEARKIINRRAKTAADAARWVDAAKKHDVPEGHLDDAADAGRRFMDFESTLALALLNKPAPSEKSDKSKK